MMAIYHDVGGSHSTAVAAHIHTNQLPMEVTPTKEELLQIKTFDRMEKKDQGHLIYIGRDEMGVDVYTVSRQYQPHLVLNAIRDTYRICKGTMDGLYIFGTMPAVNLWMKIGGYSSRRLKLVSFGRPIVTYGTLKAYPDLVRIVRDAKKRIAEDLKNS